MNSKLLILRCVLLVRQLGCCGQTDITKLSEEECDSLMKEIVRKGNLLLDEERRKNTNSVIEKTVNSIPTENLDNPNEFNRLVDLLEHIYLNVFPSNSAKIKEETKKIMSGVYDEKDLEEGKSNMTKLDDSVYELMKTLLVRVYETSNIVVFDHNKKYMHDLKKPYTIPAKYHFTDINDILAYTIDDEKNNTERHKKIYGLLKSTYSWLPNEKISYRIYKVLKLYGIDYISGEKSSRTFTKFFGNNQSSLISSSTDLSPIQVLTTDYPEDKNSVNKAKNVDILSTNQNSEIRKLKTIVSSPIDDYSSILNINKLDNNVNNNSSSTYSMNNSPFDEENESNFKFIEMQLSKKQNDQNKNDISPSIASIFSAV